jgi:hypothetical protein
MCSEQPRTKFEKAVHYTFWTSTTISHSRLGATVLCVTMAMHGARGFESHHGPRGARVPLGPLRPNLVFVITFRKNYPQLGPKNGLERRPLRFSTICAKNQVLNLKIDKVTVILRSKSPLWTPSPCPSTPFAQVLFMHACSKFTF